MSTAVFRKSVPTNNELDSKTPVPSMCQARDVSARVLH